jgi:tetratricopeptide (TPR) repeat protein
VLTGAPKTLDDAEKLYQANDLEGAKKLFLSVIQETDLRPLHASAYYGLGRIAVRQNDPETGERLLGKALDLQPEPWVRAWTLVYLGRLAQAAGEKAEALQRFQGALEVEGASTEARKQAQLGIQQNSK